ncbi:uncharacterized protein BYT42DRAFT_554880 [Radiomyces spectabilis]|uniref:uncharacterized protein n=1 Tax=Radiomyces spectabilis TaxID=64574 RepID=UPI00221F6C4F|nr:uncharacterized protein BYT42DRAFT_554880 [Radiomyces spectabilis]KAI8390915.1 hypothetical protein BYT42DRAFT_554880 [Radiomyces spectabilis]
MMKELGFGTRIKAKKPRLTFTYCLGFGEAKVNQQSGARSSLCNDMLRLITFCKIP